VGGSRLTAFGTAVVLLLVLGVQLAPSATDRQVLALLWTGLLAAFVLGVAWPLWAVRRIEVTATSPRDATVGQVVDVEVVVTGATLPCAVRSLDPTGPWHGVASSGLGTVEHLADQRGLFQLLRLEVRTSAPLGILSARRVHEIALPFAVEVAPRALEVDWLPAPAPVEGGLDVATAPLLGGELVRTVRPYAAGDPAHLVHWPSTARLGSLVVRELEPPTPLGQAVVVDLRGLGADRERAAAYALGAAWAVLRSGGDLVLCTAEAGGPVTGRLRTQLDAGRRLARAVEGEPGAPPEGWAVVEIGT
jgi:uncharacterized protein (DUF58 family)